MIQTPTVNLTETDPNLAGWHRETSFLTSYSPQGAPNIFVIGAYSGTIAGLLIDQQPDAQHYLFEPQDWACKQLAEKFGHLPNVRIYPFGLGDRSGTFRMGLYTSYDCTFMRSESVRLKDLSGVWYDAEMRAMGGFLSSEDLRHIYYASINIEGYEYVLLPYMAKMSILANCQCVGISWHDARFNCPIPGAIR